MNFNPVHASNILQWDPGEKTWLWKPFIPTGSLCLMVAFMKTGKSTFVYPLAISIAQGKAFLGYQTLQGGVLILSLEESWVDVRDRLKRFGMNPNDPIFVHCGPLKCDEQTLSQIGNFISQNKISMVIIDTLSMFWGVSDENNNAEVIRKISPILNLARSTGCSICLVHHESKSGGTHGRSIRGASSLLGIVDQSLILERRIGGNQKQRLLKTIGRFSESPSELVIVLEGDEWVSLGSGSDAWKTEQEALVLHALRQGPKSVEEVGRITDLSAKQSRRCLEALLSQNKTKRFGEGKKNAPHVYSLK